MLVGAGLVAATTVAAAPAGAVGTAHITGTVTGSGGALAGVTVSAYQGSVGGGWTVVANDTTDGDGSYDIVGLDEGDYTLGFFDGPGGRASEYWNDVTSLSAAETFLVTTSGVEPKNAVLASGRHIQGTVTAAGGVALAGVEVSAYPSQPVAGERVVVEFDETDEQGRYDISRLPAGSYRLGFRDVNTAREGSTYPAEFWNNQADVESADDIVLTTTEASVANAVLGPEVASSAALPSVQAIVNTKKPELAGATRVGRKLTVSGGAWSPGAVALSYQWLANGKPIKGATRAVLKLKAGQAGKKITVRVTAAAAGHTATTVTTAPTKKVRPRRT